MYPKLLGVISNHSAYLQKLSRPLRSAHAQNWVHDGGSESMVARRLYYPSPLEVFRTEVVPLPEGFSHSPVEKQWEGWPLKALGSQCLAQDLRGLLNMLYFPSFDIHLSKQKTSLCLQRNLPTSLERGTAGSLSIGELPKCASGKEPACQCRRHKRHGFEPCVGKIPWKRAQQFSPVFLPGESHGLVAPGPASLHLKSLGSFTGF